jgi:hypothetical protein
MKRLIYSSHFNIFRPHTTQETVHTVRVGKVAMLRARIRETLVSNFDQGIGGLDRGFYHDFPQSLQENAAMTVSLQMVTKSSFISNTTIRHCGVDTAS